MKNKIFVFKAFTIFAFLFLSLATFSHLFLSNSFLKANDDTETPELVSWAFNKNSINTQEGADSITMYIRMTDNMSGVIDNPHIEFSAVEAEGKWVTFAFSLMEEGCDSLPAGLNVDGLNGNCGDDKDGVYSATVEFPRYSAKGEWRLERKVVDGQIINFGSLVLMDKAGNQEDALYTGKFSGSIVFTNKAKIHDIESPVLKNISISPTRFDTSDNDVTITVVLEVEDDISGVETVGMSIKPLTSPEETKYFSYGEDEKLNFIKGDKTNGEIELKFVMSKGSRPGFWEFESISLSDALGNHFGLGGKWLTFAFPKLDIFLINQALSDSVLIDEDWYLEEWDDYGVDYYLTNPLISIKFEAGTVVTKVGGGPFGFHRMLGKRYNVSNMNDFLSEANSSLDEHLNQCVSSEGCVLSRLNDSDILGVPIHVAKVGIPGLNLRFSKPVRIAIAVEEKYLGETLTIQSFGAGSSAWSNETTCTVEILEPHSTEHGGGEFGFFKPEPYPACVFTIDHATYFSLNVLGANDSTPLSTDTLPETGQAVLILFSLGAISLPGYLILKRYKYIV